MISIFENTDELSVAAAKFFVAAATEAIGKHDRFDVVLTGGSSPIQLHKLLATNYKDDVDWSKVFVFWGDERWVPITDEKSNAKMAFDTLLNHVPIPAENIFVMYGEAEPQAYAATYEAKLKEHFGSEPVSFDLIILGMGDDGHTASLFPGMEVLHEKSKLVTAYWLAAQDMYRITLTEPCINAAKKILFITFGPKKANALYEVLQGEHNPEMYPSQLIKRQEGSTFWYVDVAAADKLSMDLKHK